MRKSNGQKRENLTRHQCVTSSINVTDKKIFPTPAGLSQLGEFGLAEEETCAYNKLNWFKIIIINQCPQSILPSVTPHSVLFTDLSLTQRATYRKVSCGSLCFWLHVSSDFWSFILIDIHNISGLKISRETYLVLNISKKTGQRVIYKDPTPQHTFLTFQRFYHRFAIKWRDSSWRWASNTKYSMENWILKDSSSRQEYSHYRLVSRLLRSVRWWWLYRCSPVTVRWENLHSYSKTWLPVNSMPGLI